MNNTKGFQMKLYLAVFIALGVASVAGCSTESMKAYTDATTSRTAGMWEGEGVCKDVIPGVKFRVRYDLKATSMPLTATGTTNVELTEPDGSMSGAYAEANSESAIGGNGTVIETKILKRYGKPGTWKLLTYTGKFIDDNTWETSQCGTSILMKRVQVFSTQ